MASNVPAGSERSRTAKSTRTASKSSKPECETALWILPPSAPTLDGWMESLGPAESISSAEGSLARTSAQPEQRKENDLGSPENVVDCGPSCSGSFARYNLASSCWKTSQLSLRMGLETFSETWPAWGMTLNGECFQLADSVPHIAGNVCGLLPTPTASDANGSGRSHKRKGIERGWTNLKDYCSLVWKLAYPPVLVVEYMMGYPIGWTGLEPLETLSFPSWLNGSAGGSGRHES